MNNIIFSSWGGRVFDGREGAADMIVGHTRASEEDVAFLPELFKQNTSLKALIGWDGIVIRSPDVNVVDLCRTYIEAVRDQSCGKCAPCPQGTGSMAEILNRISDGQGRPEDLPLLRRIANAVIETSRCGIGESCPVSLLHAMDYFPDAFNDAIANGVERSDKEYHSRVTAPCMEACPIHLDIPRYVDHIRSGEFEKSLDLIRTRLPLPGVLGRTCFRPCEDNCRRANMDEPIAIKSLKRFVADAALNKGIDPKTDVSASEMTGHIAIIGAGPAGLGCAYHLAKRGHKVTVYEMLGEPGGMSAVGIPDYRLPREVLRYETKLIQDLGVEIHYNTRVGKDVMLADLERDFNAVFISVGAQNGSPMRVEGEHEGYEGYISGVTYLLDINNGLDPYPNGNKVVVIGGGNVAIDCVRTALRVGKDDVNLIYRRTRNEMPAEEVEIVDAEEEQVNFHFLTAPQRIVADNGKVVGLECVRMKLGEPDSSGRRRPVAVEGSEFVFECDTVVSAIGQKVDLSFMSDVNDIETTSWKTIVVDEVTKQTSRKKIFCAGDCENGGPDALITAVAGSLKAAISIDKFINDQPLEYSSDDHFEELMKHIKLYDSAEELDKVAQSGRARQEMLEPATRRRNFDEVEQGFTRTEAMREANRCLHCYRVATVAV